MILAFWPWLGSTCDIAIVDIWWEKAHSTSFPLCWVSLIVSLPLPWLVSNTKNRQGVSQCILRAFSRRVWLSKRRQGSAHSWLARRVCIPLWSSEKKEVPGPEHDQRSSAISGSHRLRVRSQRRLAEGPRNPFFRSRASHAPRNDCAGGGILKVRSPVFREPSHVPLRNGEGDGEEEDEAWFFPRWRGSVRFRWNMVLWVRSILPERDWSNWAKLADDSRLAMK